MSSLTSIWIPMLALAGCAHSPPAPAPHSHAQPVVITSAIEGAPVRSIEIPPAAGPGEPREVKVLVDEPALKLVRIVLRGGTVLPEHHAEVPVTIQALQGSGMVTAGGTELRLDPQHPLVLAAKVPHAVAPDPGTDLVLLVHHLGRAHHGEGTH
ncbi:MAG: hypothetical protein ACKV2T_05670 [Kofleriaceae bacterium]